MRHLATHHPVQGQSQGKVDIRLGPLLYMNCDFTIKVNNPAHPDIHFEIKVADLTQ